MKFLADENIPFMAIKKLKKANIDIKAIFELSSGIKDIAIINIASKENRIIVTFDKDFGFLIIKKKLFCPGIILLRFIPNHSEDCYNLLLALLKRKDITFYHKITVVYRNKIRQRNLLLKT